MSLQVLRLGAIENLKRNLNRGVLTVHSFETAFNGDDGTLVSLRFKDRSEFAFTLFHPRTEVNASASWKSVESPGRHFVATETYEHRDFDQALGSVYSWVDRVGEELVLGAKAHADTSMVDELRRNVEATADSLPDPDKPFSLEELEDWHAQFKRLMSRLSELERENEIQSGRVEQLGRELEQLKKQGTTMPKRTWLKTAGNKVLDLLDSTSKTALKSLAEGAVKAMLEHKP
jgi:hypothetical protein